MRRTALIAVAFALGCGGGGGGGGGGGPAGAIVLLPSALSFTAPENGGSPPARAFRIANTGAGALSWTAASSVPWATPVPSSGSVAPGQVVQVSLTVDPTGQTPGTLTGDITVTAPGAAGSPRVLPVTLEVTAAAPLLALSALILNFPATEGGPNPATQVIDVLNAGVGTLNFIATPNARWITVTPLSGTTPDTLTVGVDISGLGQGIYNGFVTVSSPDAPNSPIRFEVIAAIAPAAGPPTGDTWTVMVYMNGDNGLEPFALADLNALEEANLPATVNIIVLVDRHPGHDATNGNWTDARIYEVQPDTDPAAIASAVVSTPGEINMGDPAQLRALAAFAIANYPADKYGLVIWGHGTDETSADSLTLLEVGSALADIQSDQGGGFTFDLLAFDASQMGRIEAAVEVAPFADYFVAAEELSGGEATGFLSGLSYLAGEPNASATAIAFRMSWEYAGSHRGADGIFATGAFDLASVAAIETAANALAATLETNMGAEAVSIFRALETVEELHGSESVDLADFCVVLGELTANGTVATECAAIVDAITAATLFADSGTSRPHPIMRGLSITFADDVAALGAWADMVTAYQAALAADGTDPTFTNFSLGGATVAAGGTLTGNAAIQDNLAIGGASLFAAVQTGTELALLKIDRLRAPARPTLADGREVDLWGAGPTSVDFDFSARAWAVSNGSSTFLAAPRGGVEDPGTVLVDAIYRASGTLVDVPAVIQFDAATGNLAAVLSRTAPGKIALSPADQVSTLTPVFDTATGLFSTQATGTFTVGASTQLFLIPVTLAPGSYRVGVLAEDRNGNASDASTPVTVTP